jgi:hypothetical protein
LICANRPFWGKKRQKSAFFRKRIRIFLPTFGFQKRAKAHFFWPKIGKFVRTSPENSSKMVKAHFRQNKTGQNSLHFSAYTDASLLPPNPAGLFINQYYPSLNLKVRQLTQVKQGMQQSMKSFILSFKVSKSLESSRV